MFDKYAIRILLVRRLVISYELLVVSWVGNKSLKNLKKVKKKKDSYSLEGEFEA